MVETADPCDRSRGQWEEVTADADDSKVSGRWVAILGFQPNNSSRARDDEPADRTGQR